MKISFIVCTRNRAHALADCLESIAASALAAKIAGRSEIVLVDNGSTDVTAETVEKWRRAGPVKVNYVYEKRLGLSKARNAGIRVAKGAILVFTDDDCRLSLSYAGEVLRFDVEDGDELVMRSGSVVLGDPGDLPITIKPNMVRKRWKKPMAIDDEGQLLGGALIGCNLAMRRVVVDRLGLFDESLGAGTECPAGEDTDYFYRAYLAGVGLECVPGMAVHHFHGRREIADRDKLLRNYALGNGALSFKYLFIYPRFARHLIWAGRGFLRSLFWGERGELWISACDNFRFMLLGAWRYGLGCLERRIRSAGGSAEENY